MLSQQWAVWWSRVGKIVFPIEWLYLCSGLFVSSRFNLGMYMNWEPGTFLELQKDEAFGDCGLAGRDTGTVVRSIVRISVPEPLLWQDPKWMISSLLSSPTKRIAPGSQVNEDMVSDWISIMFEALCHLLYLHFSFFVKHFCSSGLHGAKSATNEREQYWGSIFEGPASQEYFLRNYI